MCSSQRGMPTSPLKADTFSIDDKVAFLSHPANYPDQPDHVDVIETHMSWVFLTPTDVYKLKKPIQIDGLDYSTLDARQADCENEVMLNQRLAAKVYLGMLPLTIDSQGNIQINGEGNTVEWLVHMRRLPTEQMLDQAIKNQTVDLKLLRDAAICLCQFYTRAPHVKISPNTYRESIKKRIDAIANQLIKQQYALPQRLVDVIRKNLNQFLGHYSMLLDERVQQQYIIEVHGDLRPEHICLTEPPMIIDCLEFSEELRCQDPLDELAYFSIECEMLGADEIGAFFLEYYKKQNHDRAPDILFDFYRSFRAFLHAYLAARHLDDDPQQTRKDWTKQAKHLLQLAEKYSLRW